MLRTNRLRQALADGVPVYGLLNSMPSALMVEMIGYAGYDFVLLDMEHVCLNPETLEHMVRAAEGAGLTALVRVPGPDVGAILRALDCGAMGVVVPHVRSRADAELAVSASRYHPLGARGISGGRTTGFGTMPLAAYLEQANREVMVVAMVEDGEGVDNIDEILSVPGLDMVLEGAVDLSQSYGVPGQPLHALVQRALGRVAEACREHRVPFCAIPRAPGQHAAWREQGVRAFLLGDDRGVAFRALKANREDAIRS
ncbi:HpcH/HpaI aldolase family protein [Pseudoduganella namucuonensis]|uniref:4-hydroxy-2-oxoheptanedioate aldolase n=1 Tax=Pseudoduganella namucuonensis TaxID=1035707 RepID=A0A1I7JE77_9BURK|nr:aldolase/citrate lyase family protein [Pseudoduganella namucuonensis]SFU83452.1 4-hydroxy-2-oxoheptanedioate aldolase [Pseudoduganella namucuonensis]